MAIAPLGGGLTPVDWQDKARLLDAPGMILRVACISASATSTPRLGVFGMSAAGRSRHKLETGGFSFFLTLTGSGNSQSAARPEFRLV